MHQYQPGEINMLVSPSGKLSMVKILDPLEIWNFIENELLEDTPSPDAGSTKMVDPNLTPEQKTA